jgi:hypothetical protein
MRSSGNRASLDRVISLALLVGSILLVLVMFALLFGPMAAPARED